MKKQPNLDFTDYIHDLKKQGKKQIVVRSENDLMWKSGLANYLKSTYECRNLTRTNEDFVAYLSNVKSL
jgi:hypothetical protein